MTADLQSHISNSPRWFRDILDEVGDRHGLFPIEIMAQTRRSDVVRARHEAVYLVKRRRIRMSVSQIGELFRLDRTSVTYAIARHQALTGANKILLLSKANGSGRGVVTSSWKARCE